jgi:hypothetical protein
MSLSKPLTELNPDVADLFGRKPTDAPQRGSKVGACNVLHGEKRLAIRLTDVEDAADTRMRDLPGQANFLQEPRAGIASTREQELERNLDIERQIAREVDFPHGTPAEQDADAVTIGEHMTGLEPRLGWQGCLRSPW